LLDELSVIYQDGRIYDTLFPGPPTSGLFLAAQAQKVGGPILELACGTGILTIPLARRGYALTGLDRSPPMLEHARAKAAAGDVNITWVEGDMRDFSLPGTFKLIYLIHNSASHLLTNEDFAACMQCVRRHLAPGGRFIVNTFMPSLEILSRKPGTRHPFGRYRQPDTGQEVVLIQENDYDAVHQINRVQLFRRTPGQPATAVGTLQVRMYFPQEFDALLQCNGLQIERKLGDYLGTPFGQEIQTQLCVCTTLP
jgi:SAM-dependent methyltransferase